MRLLKRGGRYSPIQIYCCNTQDGPAAAPVTTVDLVEEDEDDVMQGGGGGGGSGGGGCVGRRVGLLSGIALIVGNMIGELNARIIFNSNKLP